MSSTLLRRGKVRDIYGCGDNLLLVASDRVSAFDWVIPTAIPDKGRVLTMISNFWFDMLKVPNHLISTDMNQVDPPEGLTRDYLDGRAILVHKCEVISIECVIRGYLAGSGWREYQKQGTVCGIELPKGLVNGSKLEQPIFTPATKVDDGHDENISFEKACELVGTELMTDLRQRSLDIYQRGADYAATKGIIIADTKFEFGKFGDDVLLIDEVLTPDSSRFWPQDQYEPGREQFSFDKQFVRNYLDTLDWDKNSEAPELPEDIAFKTREKYIEAYERLTGSEFRWK